MTSLTIGQIAAELFNQSLQLGTIAEVSPSSISLSLLRAGAHDGIHLKGYRHGLGEVGEYIVVLSEHVLVLAQIVLVETRQSDFNILDSHQLGEHVVAAQAKAHLLGTIDSETLRTTPGVQAYPRIGDPVFSAPASFIANIPRLTNNDDVGKQNDNQITIQLGHLVDSEVTVEITPEDLLARHCAILGTTGSGKSWTIARLAEELLKYPSKSLLIDSTGEYSSAFSHDSDNVTVCHVMPGTASDADNIFFPPSSFSEDEYFALLSPSLQAQAPVLTNAIASLRVLKARPNAADPNGYIDKVNYYSQYSAAAVSKEGVDAINNPYGNFDLTKLPQQIENECLTTNNSSSNVTPFRKDQRLVGFCESLLMRTRSIINDGKLPFRGASGARPFDLALDAFIANSNQRLLLIDISELDAVSSVRPIVVNAIGTLLMKRARNRDFDQSPFICILDEAHNFISKSIGSQDAPTRLNAFEAIAREGRKYSLCLCLATQRPRDLSESILSQIGTLITHRLTNDYDRVLVERASGDTNSSVTQFLPDLRTGEALIFGTQIPIPLDLDITVPTNEPKSNSAHFQTAWNKGKL